tara:strand:+ start:109 stop:297 length:189 start_codon:yes stop_codon:yes gene_type:complete
MTLKTVEGLCKPEDIQLLHLKAEKNWQRQPQEIGARMSHTSHLGTLSSKTLTQINVRIRQLT